MTKKITLTAEIEVKGVKTKEDAIDAIITMLNDYEDMNPDAPEIRLLINTD